MVLVLEEDAWTMPYRLPNVLLLGVQKSGTTWLFRQLEQHPEVYASNPKELFFFNQPAGIVNAKIDEYRTYFPIIEGKKVYLEGCATYFWLRSKDSPYDAHHLMRESCWETEKNIAAHLGENAKFIVVLRSPISRAVSAYYHAFRRGRTTAKSSILLQGQRDGILDMGFYRRFIIRYNSVFGKEKLLFLRFDDLVQQPQATMDKVCAFLNISQNAVQPDRGTFNSGYRLKDYGKFIGVGNAGRLKDRKAPHEHDESSFDPKSYPRVFHDEVKVMNRWYRPTLMYLASEFNWNLEGWKRVDIDQRQAGSQS